LAKLSFYQAIVCGDATQILIITHVRMNCRVGAS